jgi:chromosome partitioning protein
MKKISVFNLKGGIGKTTTCLILSNLLAQDKKVLLIDMDAANSLTSFFVEDADTILKRTVLEGLLGSVDPNEIIINVRDNFSFMPADTSLSEQVTQAGDLATLNLSKMLKKIHGFDYVILD